MHDLTVMIGRMAAQLGVIGYLYGLVNGYKRNSWITPSVNPSRSPLGLVTVMEVSALRLDLQLTVGSEMTSVAAARAGVPSRVVGAVGRGIGVRVIEVASRGRQRLPCLGQQPGDHNTKPSRWMAATR
jgi:hypothetical protein